MKILFAICILFLSSCASTFVASGPSRLEHADRLDGSSAASVAVGFTTPADPQTGFVGEASVGYEKGSLSTAGVSVDTDRFSLRLGVRYPLAPEAFIRPYLGVGVAGDYLSLKDSLSESENAFGVAGYGEIGADVPLGKHWAIGACYQHTFGSSFDIGSAKDQDLDAGTLALVLSFSL